MINIVNFSTKAEYGLRAMVVLARAYPKTRSIADISLEEKISQKYLEQLMGMLRKEKFIESRKGKNGGYVLAINPENISAGDIISVLEGEIKPMRCHSRECRKKNCPTKQVWIKLSKEVNKTLNKIKLSELIK